MLRKRKGTIEWLEFELFQDIPELAHGVFLRHGGVSQAPFTSLNVGGGTGDASEAIQANRDKIREALGFTTLISSRQVHGSTVCFDADLCENEVYSEGCKGFVTCADGLITRRPKKGQGVGLMIKHADCQAAIFYDPINHVLANVHAGWRGNVQNIYAETIRKMAQECGTRPENLLVGVGPSLGPDWSEFKNYQTELPEHFWKYQIKPLYFDLWEIAKQQLLAEGILEHHLEMSMLCTYSNPADFFSYRRDKPATGRHATLAGFKSSTR